MHNTTIRKALIYACGNSLVCDNSDDARVVSSGEIYKHQVDTTVRSIKTNDYWPKV